MSEGLTSVVIPSSVTSIGESAFIGCSGLTSVEIPNSVTSVGAGAFQNCNKLSSIKVESENTVYDSRDNCNALIETSTQKLICGCTNTIIPNSVTSIGSSAFSGCNGLTSVNIPNSVKEVGALAFSGCVGLTSITVPNSVTSIGEGAFVECSGLTSVTIGNDVTSIERSVFSGCKGLTSITLPNSVTSIGDYAFYGCSGLTSVSIPNSVTSIGVNAFEGCSALTAVTFEDGESLLSFNTDFGTGTSSQSFSSCPIGTLYLGRNISYSYIYSPFQEIKTLSSVTFGQNVTSIGDYAFSGCSGLTSVIIPNSVTSIGIRAFESCSGLTSVAIPNSVVSIGEGAFVKCGGLTSIVIPNKVEVIDKIAFTGTSITEIHITDITSWCKVSKELSFPDDCHLYLTGNKMDELEIPVSVTEIGYCAFDYFPYITSVKVHWNRPLAGGADSFVEDVKKNATLYVPKGTASMYMSAPGWIEFVNIVEYDEESAINRIETTSDTDADWYTLDGRKLEGEPTEKGVYINDGKKVYVK